MFFKYFTKYAYKKYIYFILILLLLRYCMGFVFFDKNITFSVILALLIYDLPFYLNYKHWEINKINTYRDLIEIFTSIISILCKSYSIKAPLSNVGYFEHSLFKELLSKLDDSAANKNDVDFNIVKLCNKDFQSLQHIHAPFFEEYCCDEELKDYFLIMTSNITKIERDVDLIFNLDDNSLQLDCIDNFHLQIRNICDEVNIFYSKFFYEVEKNIPINKERYLNEIIRGA